MNFENREHLTVDLSFCVFKYGMQCCPDRTNGIVLPVPYHKRSQKDRIPKDAEQRVSDAGSFLYRYVCIGSDMSHF